MRVPISKTPYQCPHCRCGVFLAWETVPLRFEHTIQWQIRHSPCPSCNRWIIIQETYEVPEHKAAIASGGRAPIKKKKVWMLVYPRSISRPVPKEIPDEFAKDFTQAARTLKDSPNASAALGRRCLQNVIRKAAGITKRSLFEEINALIESKSIPSSIADLLHASREIGNFAAHATTNVNSGEIIDVAPEEADWLLEVLEAMFDFYFVAPAKNAARKRSIDEKIKDAGKDSK